MTYGGVTRHMRIGKQPLAKPVIAEGYLMRTTHGEEMANCRRIATLLNAAFHRDFHTGEEFQNFVRTAPCYRDDLDLVAVAPDGSFAAYVGIAYDEDNRKGIFEPVCTHPDHQRKGLAHALMTEGLHRLRAIGAIEAIVETGDAIPANALYTGMGFTEVYKNYAWKKVW
jgi:mycothiol synthase